MYLRELVLIIISLNILSANANEFITVSTTHSPPTNQRRNRQEHENFDKPDQTCEAVARITFLLEIIKLQSARIDTNLEKQSHLHQTTINSSFIQLHQMNAYMMSEMKRELEETKEYISNVFTLLPNRLGHVWNNALKVNQKSILSEIQNMLNEKLQTHETKLEETKQVVAAQIKEIEKEVKNSEEQFSSFEKHMEEKRKELIGEIRAVREEQLQLQTRSRDGYHQKLEDLQKQMSEVQESLKKLKNLPRNCKEVQSRGSNFSGVYYIQPDFASGAFKVFCDMKTKGGGWIYLMNRFDGSQNFYLNWTDYRNGFGSLNGEFWLGLEHVYELTGENPNELLIELVDWDNKTARVHYSSFSIGSEKESYPLKILKGYSGNTRDSLSYHLNMNFSTADHDKNKGGYCAKYFNGGWWYKDCFTTHLTGIYLKGNASTNAKTTGIQWNGFRHFNYSYSLKQARMMVRPQSGNSILLPHEREN